VAASAATGAEAVIESHPAPSPARALGGRTALIRNPLSRRNRKPGARGHSGLPEVIVAEPDSLPALADTLADFARREVGLIIIDGGDGTVREVLTGLPGAYGDAPPRIAVMASGTTNLIAADVGAGRSDPSTVLMLAAMARSGVAEASIQRRSSLAVSWPDGSRPPVHGMFLGAAAFTRATDISVRLVRQGKIDESAGIAATLMSALAQTFAGPERERWMQGDPMAVMPAGEAGGTGARFIFLASTLQKLVLGIWPFWGGDSKAGGVVRYLDVAAPPRRLVTALPAVMRGRPHAWMPGAGYNSGVATWLDLEINQPFVIDGEVFQAGADGRVRLSAGQSLEFLVP